MSLKKKEDRLSTNSSGQNQHRKRALIDDYPNLCEILQGYVNDNIREEDMPEHLFKDHGIDMKMRTIQKYKKDLGVVTVRRSGLSAVQKATAVDLLEENDPLNRWGGRLIQEKLSHKGLHLARDEIMKYRKLKNPDAAASRHPRTRKIHCHGLWSIGPNEEWGVDGHEKILRSMGIAVYGVVDKFSRMELALWAMPNARISEVPPAVMLRLLKVKGGMPLTVTGDKGSELGLLISLITTMRTRFQPFIQEDQLPAFKAVKSVYNITRERGWRGLWYKELGNIAHLYELGKIPSGYIENDIVHSCISAWLWGTIVQLKLDELLHENHTHKIRKQKGLILPSGARRIDIYTSPEKYGASTKDRLIKIPMEKIDELLEKYDRPDLFAFGSLEDVALCEKIYTEIGKPELSARVGWKIFVDMVNYYIYNEESLSWE